jgi:hypothetical protein
MHLVVADPANNFATTGMEQPCLDEHTNVAFQMEVAMRPRAAQLYQFCIREYGNRLRNGFWSDVATLVFEFESASIFDA